MKIYVFQASTDRSTYGITPDSSGSNLPPLKTGGWVFFKTIDLLPGQSSIALDHDEALAGIAADGYFLTGAKVSTTTTVGAAPPTK